MLNLKTLSKTLLLLLLSVSTYAPAQVTQEKRVEKRLIELDTYWKSSNLAGVLSMYFPNKSPLSTLEYNAWKEMMARQINTIKKWQFVTHDFFPYNCTTAQNHCVRTILQRPLSKDKIQMSYREYEWQQYQGDWYIVREWTMVEQNIT